MVLTRLNSPQVARAGRIAAHTPKALAKQSNTQRQHRQAETSWSPASQPAWLTAEAYQQQILPRLAKLSNSAIASRIGVSRWYAGRIRKGYCPHRRHWQALAEIVAASMDPVK